MIAEGLAGVHQRGVVLEAGQELAGLQQTTAQMTLASAPVQPVLGCACISQATTEGFDLCPLAAGHAGGLARACGSEFDLGQGPCIGKAQRLFGQCWKRHRQRRRVERLFGVFQGAPAQRCRQGWVLVFPGQRRLGEGAWPPQGLVRDQEAIERLEALVEQVAVQVGGRGHDDRRTRGRCQPRARWLSGPGWRRRAASARAA